MSVSEKRSHAIKIGNSDTAANVHSAILPLFTHYKGMQAHCKPGLRIAGLLIIFSDYFNNETSFYSIYNIAVVNMVLSKYLFYFNLWDGTDINMCVWINRKSTSTISVILGSHLKTSAKLNQTLCRGKRNIYC